MKTLRIVALVLGVRALCSKWLVVAVVYGRSMEPTVSKGDYVLGIQMSRQSWRSLQIIRRVFIRRGAVVLLRPPAVLYRLQLKRIDAVPGDLRSWGWGDSWTGLQPIPPDHVFVVGDASRNEPASPSLLGGDSQYYGPCPANSLVARVFLRYRPPWRFRYLSLKIPKAREERDPIVVKP